MKQLRYYVIGIGRDYGLSWLRVGTTTTPTLEAARKKYPIIALADEGVIFKRVPESRWNWTSREKYATPGETDDIFYTYQRDIVISLNK